MSLLPRVEPEGILLIDKPAGLTSHDVVYRVRRKLQTKRVGHAGTLDPMATGLLVMLVGKATKASQYLMGADKIYEGTVRLGVTTNTQDADGETIETQPVPAFTKGRIEEALNGFLGDQYQTPPMFSAIKVGGVPLYKLARVRRSSASRDSYGFRDSNFSASIHPISSSGCTALKGRTCVRSRTTLASSSVAEAILPRSDASVPAS